MKKILTMAVVMAMVVAAGAAFAAQTETSKIVSIEKCTNDACAVLMAKQAKDPGCKPDYSKEMLSGNLYLVKAVYGSGKTVKYVDTAEAILYGFDYFHGTLALPLNGKSPEAELKKIVGLTTYTK